MKRIVRLSRRISRPGYLALPVAAVILAQLIVAASQPSRIDESEPLSQKIEGRAVFPGAVIGNVRYGVTFSGTATGSLPGWWTVALNYTPGSAAGGMVNNVVGGRWQFTQFENGLYKGSLFGDVTGGRIVRDPTGALADVEADFVISGGTGAYVDATGTGRLSRGEADHTPFPPSLHGNVEFQFAPSEA